MPAPTEREERAIQRAVGVDAYNLWKTLLTTDPITGYQVHLQDMWEDQQQSVKLVAAEILTSLADPSNERSIKLDGKGSEDTKGQMQAWLAKANQLRSSRGQALTGRLGPQFSNWAGDADECIW